MSQVTRSPIPSAREVMQQSAINEAKLASERARHSALADTEKKALIDQLSQAPGTPDHEKISLAMRVIQRAVTNGLTEVQVYRFPHALCTDRGRAIGQQRAGWEKTLTGIPEELHRLWADHLQPLGYRIKFQIIDFPGGMPGDIGVTVSWGEQ